jgi:hypothetical protein
MVQTQGRASAAQSWIALLLNLSARARYFVQNHGLNFGVYALGHLFGVVDLLLLRRGPETYRYAEGQENRVHSHSEMLQMY